MVRLPNITSGAFSDFFGDNEVRTLSNIARGHGVSARRDSYSSKCSLEGGSREKVLPDFLVTFYNI